MKRILNYLKEKIVYATIAVILILIASTSFFAFWNQRVMKETDQIVSEAELAILKTNELLRWLNLMDLGVRGYGLGKTEALLSPFDIAIKGNPKDIDTIRWIMRKQGFSTVEFDNYQAAIDDYVNFCNSMITLARIDSMDQFKSLMAEDRGFGVWKTYQTFSEPFIKYENELKTTAEKRYIAATMGNTIIQAILLLLGIPCLIIIYYRIRREEKERAALLLNLEANNREYVFNPGTPVSSDASHIMNASIVNIKTASSFIKSIMSGKFDVEWPGMNDQIANLNEQNLSGTLISMRNQMKEVQEEDRIRLWATEGLTKFTEIIRQNQHDPKLLAEQATRFIVRYMDAQQGGTFVHTKGESGNNDYLELIACYAFDKKKFIEKKISIGSGLIGQTYLEGTTVFLKQVPNGYTHITSGLGDATPTCVLIVPMKYNDVAEGVFELAGFTEWPSYQQEFVSKATEYMAASISTLRSTQQMKNLVEQMQEQTQRLNAQEEEMRQNMEELAATNEEMKRKEAEYLKIINQ
jgi:CHASE3 domain sensor protein